MKKKIIAISLALALTLGMAAVAVATTVPAPIVRENGGRIELIDAHPEIIPGRPNNPDDTNDPLHPFRNVSPMDIDFGTRFESAVAQTYHTTDAAGNNRRVGGSPSTFGLVVNNGVPGNTKNFRVNVAYGAFATTGASTTVIAGARLGFAPVEGALVVAPGGVTATPLPIPIGGSFNPGVAVPIFEGTQSGAFGHNWSASILVPAGAELGVAQSTLTWSIIVPA
jgi:opacity protein-like surface antigen